MSSHHDNKLVLLGRFGAPHGVRGEIRLQSFTSNATSIADYGVLTDKTGAKSIELLSVHPHGKDMLLARVAGVTSRESAQALTGLELYLSRANLPPAREDEFYCADLIGLRAVAANGETLGHVCDVRNFGAGDILEIKPLSDAETYFLPFTKLIVPCIDFTAGYLVINPPIETQASPED
jgi:16S rRNA processing protein RimM